MRTIICDRCGKRETDKPLNLGVCTSLPNIHPVHVSMEVHGLTGIYPAQENVVRVDLCADCREWVKLELTAHQRSPTVCAR